MPDFNARDHADIFTLQFKVAADQNVVSVGIRQIVSKESNLFLAWEKLLTFGRSGSLNGSSCKQDGI